MAPRNKESNQQILDQRREQILSTALRVFAHRGFAATKISDIAVKAGLSHGLIYHYFKTKDDIFTELVKRTYEITDLKSTPAIVDGNPFERLKNTINMIISITFTGDGLYYWHIINQAFISEVIPLAVQELNKQHKNAFRNMFLPIIKAGQKSGQISPDDPEKLTTAIYSILNGIAMQLMRARNTPEYPVSVPDTDMILRLCKAQSKTDSQISPPTNSVYLSPFNLKPSSLTYHLTSGQNQDKTNLFYKISEAEVDSKQLVEIKSEIEEGNETITRFCKSDWTPVSSVIKSHTGELLSLVTYQTDSVQIEIPGRSLNSSFEPRKPFFDITMSPFILGAYTQEGHLGKTITFIYPGGNKQPIGPFTLEVQKEGNESIVTSAGNFACYKLRTQPVGVSQAFLNHLTFYYWFSVKEPQMLVRFEGPGGQLKELIGLD